MESEINQRYSRQTILEEIGVDGQSRLLDSSVVVIGCGALGGFIANNLVRGGLGTIRIIDRDIVELNNLQRQILFDEEDIGKPKASTAFEKLKRINSEVIIDPVVDDVNFSNIESLITGFDLVIDGTDNLETRMIINDACVKRGIPWVYGGTVGRYGMSMNILPGGPCLRCVLPQLPEPGLLPTCDTYGILNTLPPFIASVESTEALKILLGHPPNPSLLYYDLWAHDYNSVEVNKNKNCECCVKNNYEFLDSKGSEIISSLCGANTIQIIQLNANDIPLDSLAERLAGAVEVEKNPGHIRFMTGDYEVFVFSNGRTLIRGTEDRKIARSIYARYVGK